MESNAYRRAALVVASLDRRAADDILNRMPADQASAIRSEIMSLQELNPSEQKVAIDDFLRNQASGSQATEVDFANDNTSNSFRAQRDAVAAQADSSLHDLLQHDDRAIALAIRHERTSVVAALISVLPGKRAAGVLRHLPDRLQSRVLAVISLGIAPSSDAIGVIADQICDKRVEIDVERRVGLHHQDALQAIFDELSPEERTAMLRDLAAENPMLAQRLSVTKSSASNDCYC